jgi:hypothetical protein
MGSELLFQTSVDSLALRRVIANESEGLLFRENLHTTAPSESRGFNVISKISSTQAGKPPTISAFVDAVGRPVALDKMAVASSPVSSFPAISKR